MGPGFESLKADHVYKRFPLHIEHAGPLVKWLRQRPLTPLTSVRIPEGAPLSVGCLAPHRDQKILYLILTGLPVEIEVGVDWREGPPVPIPNTEVKLTFAEDTCRVTDRENR